MIHAGPATQLNDGVSRYEGIDDTFVQWLVLGDLHTI